MTTQLEHVMLLILRWNFRNKRSLLSWILSEGLVLVVSLSDNHEYRPKLIVFLNQFTAHRAMNVVVTAKDVFADKL